MKNWMTIWIFCDRDTCTGPTVEGIAWSQQTPFIYLLTFVFIFDGCLSSCDAQYWTKFFNNYGYGDKEKEGIAKNMQEFS